MKTAQTETLHVTVREALENAVSTVMAELQNQSHVSGDISVPLQTRLDAEIETLACLIGQQIIEAQPSMLIRLTQEGEEEAREEIELGQFLLDNQEDTDIAHTLHGILIGEQRKVYGYLGNYTLVRRTR